MPITPVDKMKINKYLKENELDKITYLNMCEAIGKKGKITDVEFLEFFTDYVVNDFRLKERIYIKQLTKVVYTVAAFLKFVKESGSDVSEDTLDKIRNFRNLYNEFLERTGTNINSEFLEFNDKCIEYVLNKVNKLYPCEEKHESSCEDKHESASKYINEIQALNDEIKNLRKELDNINKNYDKLQAIYNKEYKNIEVINNQNNAIKKELDSKEYQISNLNETIELLNKKIVELENEISKNLEEKNLLESYKVKYNEISEEVKKLNGIIENNLKEKEEKIKIEVKHSNLEKFVYEKLLVNELNINDLINLAIMNGFNTNKEEMYEILKNLRKKINISDNAFSTSPIFKVVTPNVLEDEPFTINVPKGGKYFDILLVSDFHLTNVNEKVLNGFDTIYEYCAKNNINLVLNLGDFYDGIGGKKVTYEDAMENYKLVEQLINKIPKMPGMYHGILGGNHESNILKYGYDPIKFLADEREEFFSLGYKHSTITLKESENILGSFDIHHPYTFNFQVDLDDNLINIEDLQKYLKSIYKKQGRSRDDSYIDLFGHVHRSQMNFAGSYCFIPKYFDGNNKKGAIHLRIYYKDKFKYMVFIPLLGNNKLFKANEVIYQKILTK